MNNTKHISTVLWHAKHSMGEITKDLIKNGKDFKGVFWDENFTISTNTGVKIEVETTDEDKDKRFEELYSGNLVHGAPCIKITISKEDENGSSSMELNVNWQEALEIASGLLNITHIGLFG